MEIEKTQLFPVDNKTHVVADLPPGFRKRFAQLDYMKKRAGEQVVEAEMAQMAVNVTMLQLQELIRNLEAANSAASSPPAEGTSPKDA